MLKADIGGFGIVAYEDVNSKLDPLVGYKVHDRDRFCLGIVVVITTFIKIDTIKSFGWYHGSVLGTVFAF